MTQLLNRDLDPSVVAALKLRARLHRRSLAQELRAILTEAVKTRREHAIRVADEFRAMTPAGAGIDTAAMLREDRDRAPR